MSSPFSFARSIYRQYRDYNRALDSVLNWISRSTTNNAFLLADELTRKRLYNFTRVPKTDVAQYKVSTPRNIDISRVDFVFCRPGKLLDTLQAVCPDQHGVISDANWYCLFYSLNCELWESRLIHRKDLPIRFGLSDAEKMALLMYARQVLRHYLCKKEASLIPATIDGINQARWSEQCSINVTLWVDGVLRGSMIVKNKPLGQAISQAAVLASTDVRFKPLNEMELEATTIEVFVFSDLSFPLSREEFLKHKISPSKGYFLDYQGHRAWYLPSALRTSDFRGLSDFLYSLSSDKASLDNVSLDSIADHTSTFEVMDFVESGKREGVINPLAHLMLEQNVDASSAVTPYEVVHKQLISPIINEAAEWLLTVQDPDGFFASHMELSSANRVVADWARSAFAAWALAEFGRANNISRYTRGALLHVDYATRILPRLSLPPDIDFLMRVYLGEAALTLGKKDHTLYDGVFIQEYLQRSKLGPICLLQGARYLYALTDSGRGEFLKVADESAMNALRAFHDKRNRHEPIVLAEFAELCVLACYMQSHERCGITKEEYRNLRNWFLGSQLVNGAFPTVYPGTEFNTRGTSKVLEVLAHGADSDSQVIKGTFQWLSSMQYTDETMFYIPIHRRDSFGGGFRLGALNYRPWIDVAAHVVMAGAYLIDSNFPI